MKSKISAKRAGAYLASLALAFCIYGEAKAGWGEFDPAAAQELKNYLLGSPQRSIYDTYRRSILREGARLPGDYEVRFGAARINESYNGIFDFDVARFALPFDSAKTDARGVEFVPATPRDSLGFRLEGSSRGAAGKVWAGKEFIDDGYDIIVELGLTGASDIGVDISNSKLRTIANKYSLNDNFQYTADAAKYGYYANATLIGASSSAQITLARYGVSGNIPFMLDTATNFPGLSLEQRQTTLGLFKLNGSESSDLKWDFSAYWTSIYSNLTSQPPPGYFGLTPPEPAKSDEKRYGGSLNTEIRFRDKNILDWQLGGQLEYESGKYYAETDTSFINYPNVERISGSLYAYFFDRDLFISLGPDYYLFSSPQQKEKIKFDGLHAQLSIKKSWEKYLFLDIGANVFALPPKMKDVITVTSPRYKNEYRQSKLNFNLIYILTPRFSVESGIVYSAIADSTHNVKRDGHRIDNIYDAGVGLRYKLENLSFATRYDYFRSEKTLFAFEGEFHTLLLETRLNAFSDNLDLVGQYRRLQFKKPVNLLGSEINFNLDPARFFARFDNILNESYDVAPGFPASGISFVIGVRYDAGTF